MCQAFSAAAQDVGNFNLEIHKLTIRPGVETEVAYFKGTGKQAIVFVPGSRYQKDSWYFLADRFQQLGIASLALDGSSISNSIDFLKQKGYNEITLIGGSMGGEAVLSYVEKSDEESINKIVVLAPYGGNPIKNDKISKLFVVATKDMHDLHSDIVTLHDESAEPKMLKVYESRAHAQELFMGKDKEDVINLILKFVSQDGSGK